MSVNQQGQVLLVYTWNRKRIKSVVWEPVQLQNYLQHAKADTFELTPVASEGAAK
jgi:hypothetical protein